MKQNTRSGKAQMSSNILEALGTNKAKLLRFEAALNSNPELRAGFLRAPDAAMREAGFDISENTATLLTRAVKEALERQGNPDLPGSEISITTRISISDKTGAGGNR